MAKILITMRQGRCMKIRAKTLWNNFRMKATANEVDVTTKTGFSEDKNGQTESLIFTDRRKRKKITYDFLA